MTKIMEYKITTAATRSELAGCVNSLILMGWRPYGIPFYIKELDLNDEDLIHLSWNQTMVRLSVKDEEESEETLSEIFTKCWNAMGD